MSLYYQAVPLISIKSLYADARLYIAAGASYVLMGIRGMVS